MSEILSPPGTEEDRTMHFHRREPNSFISPIAPAGRLDLRFFRRPIPTKIELQDSSEVIDFCRFPTSPKEENQLSYDGRWLNWASIQGPESILNRLEQYLIKKGHIKR